MNGMHYDVAVVGAGASGVAAAVAAARSGASTVLIDAGPMPGGELLSGMTIDGAINAHGERIVGGVLADLLAICEEMGGYVGAYSDWRLIQYHCCDPEITKIAVSRLLAEAGVELLLHSFVDDVVRTGDRVEGLVVRNKSGRTLIRARVMLDCSGDGDVCALAGARFHETEDAANLQPVSMMFRMANVETAPLLDFACAAPENLALGESEAIRGGRTDREIAEEIRRQGQPCIFLRGDGPFLGKAIAEREMYPTALIMIQPTSTARREVCINSTRVGAVDGVKTEQVSAALSELFAQVWQCADFLRRRVPGFENAVLSGGSTRVGIRETRRVLGEAVLETDDVLAARKRTDGIAKGSHHVDIHQSGTGQIRIPVANGGSYDIPFGALVPVGLSNVLVAGRCLSATREAQGSARVMGSCMAMGHAIGAAAAIALERNDACAMADIPAELVRDRLAREGAILDGPA